MKKTLILVLAFLFVLSSCKSKKKEEKSSSQSKKATVTTSKTKNSESNSGSGFPKNGKVNVALHVMSQCPYGTRAEGMMDLVLGLIGNSVNFRLEYIADSLPSGGFNSLHGQAEVDGDIVQLCVQKIDAKKLMKFVMCQNMDARKIQTNWKACAQKVGIDTARLKKCKESGEGKILMRNSIKASKKLNFNASPSFAINGVKFDGAGSPRGIINAICKNIKGKKPEVCNAPKFKGWFISDKRCEKCKGFARLITVVKQLAPGAVMTELDYSDAKAKDLMKKLSIKKLPVIFFDSGISKDKLAMKIFTPIIKKTGGYNLLVQPPAFFDPTAEMCGNKIDDDKNGKTDCDDPACKDDLTCRKEIKGRLDLFVMSQCPYGTAAFLSMNEVLKNFKNKMDFHVNYIASKTPTGFNSLHGQPEVDENIRELCAIKHFPKDRKYMDYIWCRSKDVRNPDWKKCAVKGIDAKIIETCFKGDEGKKLLAENLVNAEKTKVSGSPTWLVNNRYKFGGIDAETVRKNFCKYNPGLKECATKLKSGAKVMGSCGK